MAWEYESHELQVLCADCHKHSHSDREFLDRLIAEATSTGVELKTISALLGGYFSGILAIDPFLEAAACALDGDSHDDGILASMSGACPWDRRARAAFILTHVFTPSQVEAVERWADKPMSEIEGAPGDAKPVIT